MNKNKIINFLLILLGLIVLSWLIWSRFIRERLPKDIPFFLTENRFLLLIYISLIYLYIVKSIIFPKEQKTFIKIFIEIIFLPLETLDKNIKKNYTFSKIIIKIVENQNFIIFVKNNIFSLYIIFRIIPRLILLTLLIVDIFYYKEIKNLYNYILLGSLPLLFRYLKYTLKNIKIPYKTFLSHHLERVNLEDEEEIKIDLMKARDRDEMDSFELEYIDKKIKETIFGPYHNKEILIEEYVEKILEEEYPQYTYTIYPYNSKQFTNKFFRKKYNFTKEEIDKYYLESETLSEKELRERPISIVYGKIYDYNYLLLNNVSNNYAKFKKLSGQISKISDNIFIRIVLVIIYSLYAFCWLYLLYKSIHTLDTENLEIIEKLFKILEKIKANED